MTEYRIVKISYKYQSTRYEIQERTKIFGIPVTFWECLGANTPFVTMPSFNSLKEAKEYLRRLTDKATYEVCK